MAIWDEFTKLVVAGEYSSASQWMYVQEPKNVFEGCFALALNQHAAFSSYWDSVPNGEKIADLILDFVYFGYMPQRSYAQVSWSGYDTVRELYLRSVERGKLPAAWPSRYTNSTSVCLYPEYARRNLGLRAAIVQLALDHTGGGPSEPWQANLFCLGGRYPFYQGKQGANPRSPGTTCMLFARSILHAAGINAIGPRTPKSCSCDDGLSAELAHLACFVKTKNSQDIPVVKPGDVFMIQGKNFKGGYGSDHVGVVTAVAGNRWSCVQGGAKNHVTSSVTYTVVRAKDTTWGTWCFQEDEATANMVRGVQGFWNIDHVGAGSMMRGGLRL